MIGWLIRLCEARLRRLDVELLWPACQANASSLEHAKQAFMAHVLNDPAWRALGPREIARQVDALQAERFDARL